MPHRKVLEGLTAAVRSGSRERLRDDLREMVLESVEQWRRDDRDFQRALAPYHHGARRMGIDPVELFDEVAADVPGDLARIVREFGPRGGVSPQAFEFFVEETPDGPSYEFTAWSDEDVQAFIERMKSTRPAD